MAPPPVRLPARRRGRVPREATSRTWLFRALPPLVLGPIPLAVSVSPRFAVANAVESGDARPPGVRFPARTRVSAPRQLADAEAPADEARRYQDKWRRAPVPPERDPRWAIPV